MNLYHAYKDISFGDNAEWKDQTAHVLKHPTNDSARRFITSIYESRGKGSAFELGVFGGKDLCKKNVHTASTFLLGLHLKSIACKTIEARVKEMAQYRFGFDYLWFLTCLYHDTTAAFEKDTEKIEKAIGDNFVGGNPRIQGVLEVCGIDFEYSLYGNDTLGLQLPSLHHTYTEDVVNRYFKMRLADKSFDHGIVSGMLIYDRLLKNYKKTWLKQLDSSPDTNIECFHTYDEKQERWLWWHKKQLWAFAYIADAIIAHNIWHVDSAKKPKSAKKYIDNKLDCLVHKKGEDIGKIGLLEHPLSFYLGLIDSIEPVKYFSHVDPKYLWDNISIEHIGNTLIISQSGTALDFQKWYEAKMADMSTWLGGVNVIPPKDNVIKIELSNSVTNNN